jgi:hypothetical protein
VIERVKPRDAFFLDVIWGDGKRQTIAFPARARIAHVRHRYQIAGSYTISLRWRDQHGHFNAATLPIVIQSASPEASGDTNLR